MSRTANRDSGQAFPLYVGMFALLLFAAFAFFVVGMAGATRSQAQGAADAAALAAARDVRDNVFSGLDLTELRPEDWQGILDGKGFDASDACAAAEELAGLNRANEVRAGCEVALPRFTVSVQTDDPVGKSVIPGTQNGHATATATAVIEPRCWLAPVPTPGPTPPPTDPPDGGTGKPDPDPIDFECVEGKAFKLDPLNPGELSDLARSMFKVRLDG
ncbi:pilus assembly protein TadG-related protein [Streptomyces sp. NPDC048603]|uniref:pilus assembly protein TadG-related protein n=1 Tax=Streptomyces sp. NPDC048603 TaxID=3365577 RepID=UPI003714B1E8